MTALGGQISVTSTVGRGSVFRLTLPILPEPAEAVLPGPQMPDVPPVSTLASSALADNVAAMPHLTVVVDSNELRLAKIKAVIQPHRASLIGVTSLEEARQIIHSGQASQLVLDTSALAGQADTKGTYTAFIEQARIQQVSVIVLLGPDDGLPLQEAQAAAPDVLLQKPLKAAHLIEAIKSAAAPAGFQSQVA